MKVVWSQEIGGFDYRRCRRLSDSIDAGYWRMWIQSTQDIVGFEQRRRLVDSMDAGKGKLLHAGVQ